MAMASFAGYREEAQAQAGQAGEWVAMLAGLLVCGYLKPARPG